MDWRKELVNTLDKMGGPKKDEGRFVDGEFVLWLHESPLPENQTHTMKIDERKVGANQPIYLNKDGTLTPYPELSPSPDIVGWTVKTNNNSNMSLRLNIVSEPIVPIVFMHKDGSMVSSDSVTTAEVGASGSLKTRKIILSSPSAKGLWSGKPFESAKVVRGNAEFKDSLKVLDYLGKMEEHERYTGEWTKDVWGFTKSVGGTIIGGSE